MPIDVIRRGLLRDLRKMRQVDRSSLCDSADAAVPQHPPGRVGDDPHVHAVAAALGGVVGVLSPTWSHSAKVPPSTA